MTNSVPRREHGNAWLACASVSAQRSCWEIRRLRSSRPRNPIMAPRSRTSRRRPPPERLWPKPRRTIGGWRFSVVGPAGDLVYFEKMDGVQLASVEISQGKARTAVRFRVPSKVFADQYAAGNTVFMTFPEKPVASEGGIPIVVNDRIIGAIGVSGGTGQQDGAAANAGASCGEISPISRKPLPFCCDCDGCAPRM